VPFGLPKSIGGDSSANNAKMESCVKKVKSSGKSKESAIKICKSSLIRSAEAGKGGK